MLAAMEALESRVTALESRLARWRLLSVAMAIAAGAVAFAAARAFPPEAPALTELRISDGHHTAALTAKGLTVQSPLTEVALSVDGLALDNVTLNRFGLTLREGEFTSSLSRDKLVISKADANLVELRSSLHGGRLVLRHADGADAPTAVLQVDANTAWLDLIRPGSGGLRLSQSRMPLLCSDPPARTPDAPGACADLRDVARVAHPKR